MRVVRGAEAPRVRWRNDGGWTRELLRVPAAPCVPFEWRVSVAEVESDGPFSAFDGYDRILVLLAGAGMRLLTDDVQWEACPENPLVRFAGEAPIVASLIDGPTTDFNLVWQRDSFDVTVTVTDLDATEGVSLVASSGGTVLVYVSDGQVVAPDGSIVGVGDMVVGASGVAVHLHGAGRLLSFLVAAKSIG